jgi:hypothetical protein
MGDLRFARFAQMNIVVIWGGCQWCSWSEQIFRYERIGKAREGMKFFDRGERERLFGRRGITESYGRGHGRVDGLRGRGEKPQYSEGGASNAIVILHVVDSGRVWYVMSSGILGRRGTYCSRR